MLETIRGKSGWKVCLGKVQVFILQFQVLVNRKEFLNMKLIKIKYQHIFPLSPLENFVIAVFVLFLSLVLTLLATIHYQNKLEEIAKQNFESIGNDLIHKIETRLMVHAQLLQSCSAFFAASDTVTEKEWGKFIESLKINQNLPGIQGTGYSLYIPKDKLIQHIQSFRQNGFPNYNVIPEGDREIYTSVIYLEPFSGRNLLAFGYDMFSEPVRRKAMELSRDSNYAVLSGKVLLVQETNKDVQTGALMYVPIYQRGMHINTVEERRAAIKGWVYNPYRINDLMNAILGNQDLINEYGVRLKIYDTDIISERTMLYDSDENEKGNNNIESNLFVKFPIEFNSTEWSLLITVENGNFSKVDRETLIFLIIGILFSLLLSALVLLLLNTNLHSNHVKLLNMQLEKHNADKDRFISILGHDLKGPCNNLLGLSEALIEDLRKVDMDEIEILANQINSTAQITSKLLDDLLVWARTQQGSISFKPQILNFRDVYINTLEILEPNANAKGITINYSAPDGINVFADIDKLKTILRNLISNAIKFTNNGGVININAEENSGEVKISISDNGIGISDDNLTKLFDISQVITTKGTANEKGTGLGLLICKEFVENHRGKIWIETKIGQGSTFSFTIPCHAETEEKEQLPAIA